MKEDTETTIATIRSDMNSFLRRKRILRAFSLSLAILSALFLVLFFSLPCFQAKEAEISGLVNFRKEDIASFAGVNAYQPNFLFDTKKASLKAKENAAGFLLSVSYETDGLGAKGSVKENYPIATYRKETYLADGRTLEKALEDISSLPLNEERKTSLKEDFQKEGTSSLPEIHIPKKEELPEGYRIEDAFTPLAGLPYSSLKSIQGIEYINKGKDANWSNVAQALLFDRNHNQYYLLKGLDSEYLGDYFSPKVFPEQEFSSMALTVSSKGLASTSFSFEDDSSATYPVYLFQAMRNKNGSIRVVPAAAL